MTAGYDYGSPQLPTSPVSLEELANLKITVGMTAEDEASLRLVVESVFAPERVVAIRPARAR